jgi:hypothetical protein
MESNHIQNCTCSTCRKIRTLGNDLLALEGLLEEVFDVLAELKGQHGLASDFDDVWEKMRLFHQAYAWKQGQQAASKIILPDRFVDEKRSET